MCIAPDSNVPPGYWPLRARWETLTVPLWLFVPYSFPEDSPGQPFKPSKQRGLVEERLSAAGCGSGSVCLGRNLSALLVIMVLTDKSGFVMCSVPCSSRDPLVGLSSFN